MNLQVIPADNYSLLRATDILNDSKFASLSKSISNICNISTRGLSGDASSKNFIFDNVLLTDIFSSIKSILLQHTNKELTLTGFRIHVNRLPPVMDWHVHKKEYDLDPNNFSSSSNAHVAIFYLHTEWDKQQGGNLLIGVDRNNPIAVFDCEPNSCVIHSADLAHGVDWINTTSFTVSKRIVMYSHWVEI